MNINALMLNQCIARTNLHLDDRKYIVALALSRAIGYSLMLPTGALDSPSKFFTDTHKDAVEAILVKVNEQSVINIQECYELTFKIWKMRYALVFNSSADNVMKFLDCQLEQGNNEIPQIYTDVINKIGVETVTSFMNDVNSAMSIPEGV